MTCIPVELADPLAALPARIRLHPIRQSLWRALLLDVADLQAVLDHPGRRPTLDILTCRLVRTALDGNVKAVALIADRIEGRVGLRLDDVDPDDAAHRADRQAMIVSLITAMTLAKSAPVPEGD